MCMLFSTTLFYEETAEKEKQLAYLPMIWWLLFQMGTQSTDRIWKSENWSACKKEEIVRILINLPLLFQKFAEC